MALCTTAAIAATVAEADQASLARATEATDQMPWQLAAAGSAPTLASTSAFAAGSRSSSRPRGVGFEVVIYNQRRPFMDAAMKPIIRLMKRTGFRNPTIYNPMGHSASLLLQIYIGQTLIEETLSRV